mmetsp:Transcript_12419/g.18153  ORF Transcript_12419/g.18153 Transcript_12419/m.18153 type:complete len:270 (+) Transcript_12419:1581-2390(+)
MNLTRYAHVNSLSLFICIDFIILLGKNGGKTVRILQAGEQGLASRVYVDLELDFDNSGYEGKSVARYLTFITRDEKTHLVMPSGTSHKIAIIELPVKGYVTNDSIKVNYVTLSDADFVNSAPHGMYRRVMWAEGTDYVWVSDSTRDDEKVYIVDVAKGETVKTLTGFKSSSFLSVQNYERARQIDMQKSLVQDLQVQMTQKVTEEGRGQGIEYAAIVIGSVALIAGLANIAYMNKLRKEFQATVREGEPVKFIPDIENESQSSHLNSVN